MFCIISIVVIAWLFGKEKDWFYLIIMIELKKEKGIVSEISTNYDSCGFNGILWSCWGWNKRRRDY